jgi:integrase
VVDAFAIEGDRWADLALVLGLTGLRWGELMALRCRDVQDVPYPAPRVRQAGRTLDDERWISTHCPARCGACSCYP